MIQESNDALSRSDRVLVVALAIVLATASAALGAGMTYSPHKAAPHAASAPQASEKPIVIGSARPSEDLAMTQLLAEHRCLSEALYYEARGEGNEGEEAIAEVIFHRMHHGDYGNSICAVVYEGAGRPGCQFTFTCNGDLTRPKQAAAWKHAEELAARILTGEVRLSDETGGATNYHAVSVNPFWASTLERTTQIGNHIFYRDPPRARAS